MSTDWSNLRSLSHINDQLPGANKLVIISKDPVPIELHNHIVTQRHLYGIGKVTMVKVLDKGLMLQSLGQVDSEMADVITESSQFITNSYGCKPDNNMSSTHTLQCLDIKISHVKASAVQQSLCHLQLRHLRNMFEEHIIRLQFGWLHCSQTRLILI